MARCVAAVVLACVSGAAAFAAPRPDLNFDHLAPGFVPEVRNVVGFPKGAGFARRNPWGQYTAYVMLTDAKSRRTWRIEHNLPNVGRGTSQGSTMYLLEGSARALLIDTGNPAEETEGVSDLKTLVRHLLAHDNAGGPKAGPLDFVVANTHGHGDHTGENARMGDRPVYYPEGDWPVRAPSNYVPVRETDGPASRRDAAAVGQIDLGQRLIRVVDVPPHTEGSVAYLDPANQLLFTGDALGSAWPFLQRGPVTRFARTMRHLLEVTASYPSLVVLPAHYYQIGAFDRASWTAAERVLDRQYLVDLAGLAKEIVDGRAIGSPFASTPRDYWAAKGKAKIVYNLDTIGEMGGSEASAYHVVRIPGAPPPPGGGRVEQPLNVLREFSATIFLIRSPDKRSFFLLRGSRRALLIGGGAEAAPGLAPVVDGLARGAPLDIAILDGATVPGWAGEFSAGTLYATGARQAGSGTRALADGDVVDLGTAPGGAAMRLEAQHLDWGGVSTLTLLMPRDGVLFIGAALGELAPGGVLRVAEPVQALEGLADWLVRAGGRFRAVYPVESPAWFTDPGALDQIEQALARAATGGGPGLVADGAVAGLTRITPVLPPEAAVSILVQSNSGPDR